MFNALNRFISRLDSDTPSQSKSSYGGFGFQVLRSDNHELAIEPWFDFIVGINGRMIEDADPLLFAQEIQNCAGNTVGLGIWSAKGQRTRTIHTTVPPSGTLGLTLQHNSLSAVSTIWHILDVPANSPADVAGLLPYSDYILGTPEGVLHGEAGLGELVEDHIGRPLRLYVYNNEYDVTRELTIQPSRDWGGQGALGCTLGFGALHRLPAPLSEPIAGPGETLFVGDYVSDGELATFSNESDMSRPTSAVTDNFFVPAQSMAPAADYIVPADMPTLPPLPMTSPAVKREKKTTKVKGKGLNIDDYFMEGEEKSREQDYAPASKVPIAPPPKAGNLPPPPPPPPQKVDSPPRDGNDDNVVVDSEVIDDSNKTDQAA